MIQADRVKNVASDSVLSCTDNSMIPSPARLSSVLSCTDNTMIQDPSSITFNETPITMNE